MAMMSLLVIVFNFLTVMMFNTHCSGQICSFAYLAQPPSSTLQGCNPYDQHNDNTIVRISLDCVVKRHSTVNTNYSIEWFRENTDGLVQCLGLGDPVSQLSSTDRLSRYHDNKFINQPYSPSLLGKYWCQVINRTADPDQPLERSNVFTLLAPWNYSVAMCSNAVQSRDHVRCADEPENQTTPIVCTTQNLSSSLVNITSHPSPTGSPMIPQSITPIIAGASAGVVLVLIICSMLIVILLIIMMNRRKKQDKQWTHTGGYSNKAVSYNNCAEDNINIELQSNNTTSQPPPVIYDQPDDLKRSMSLTKEGGNIMNSEYSCLTDATTSGPPGPGSAAPMLFDGPLYDATGVSDSQYSHLENTATGGHAAYSKLGYYQTATNTLPMELTADDQYSSLNTSSNTMGRDKLAAGYGEQEYSSLQHPGVPPAPSDMTSADQQQYSVLNK